MQQEVTKVNWTKCRYNTICIIIINLYNKNENKRIRVLTSEGE